ncbi:MAG: four helix bundle protein [Bacteroidales bacterium]|jgi:four helix bundle protein|nr:four helix bundle protein [Bacteroidales bacterium]MDI9575349.1 four helix bundle protein [Bacteroidota bacterium]MDD3756228.1 four helix bundle protein [Bacteroidales bacterium]MDY0401428.1 four helix bundle protein [Bacteroidales bacterium]HHW59387.1 four helix bundle protein [Bacteroidales bacterium]
MSKINNHQELEVYQLAFTNAMEIFNLSNNFPRTELYSLTDQIRRSSRSVCANIAEAFRKRRYRKAFIAKLSDAESEAAETQVWLDFAFNCNYIDENIKDYLHLQYDFIIGKLVNMINNSDKWSL